MNSRIKIAIVDDEVLLRKSIVLMLQREANMEIVFDGGNGSELLNYIENETSKPDIILMDIRMPVLDGVETSKIIANNYPNIKIIILSSIDSNHFVELMLKYGAASYLFKKLLPQQVITAINRVYEDGIYFNSEMISMYINPNERKTDSYGQLSDCELEVLQLICQQLNAKEIADRLCLSERTIEGHRKKMMEKTKSKNVVGLILWGIRNNIIVVE